jgi:hypothetical protein
VGPHVLFVRDDGRFAVGHIDQSGGTFVDTDSGTRFSHNWTHVVAVGPRILYVASSGGLGAVGHINWIGQHVETQSGHTYSIDWTHVVAVA